MILETNLPSSGLFEVNGEVAPAPSAPAVTVEDGSSLAMEAYRRHTPEGGVLCSPSSFLAKVSTRRLTQAQKLEIVDQALLLFQNLYPNLHSKIKIWSVNPLRHLYRLRASLENLDDAAFHSEMIRNFSKFTDAHTYYSAPAPWRGSFAIMPFGVRMWFDDEMRARFVVQRVLDGWIHSRLHFGAEITHWDGHIAEEYFGLLPAGQVSLYAFGSRYDTVLARELIKTQVKPLHLCDLPRKDSAVIHYRTASGEPGAIELPWGVLMGFKDDERPRSSVYSISRGAGATLGLLRTSFRTAGNALTFVPRPAPSRPPAAKPATHFETQATGAPPSGAIDPSLLSDPARPQARFGYVRIRSFETEDTQGNRLVNEFRWILEQMQIDAPNGLVIDLRANPGGNIVAAERMLQLLSPVQPVQPIRFKLANNLPLRDALRRLGKSPDADDVALCGSRSLKPWIDSLPGWEDSQEVLTPAFPLTAPDAANDIGRVYHGPCVLIIDGLTYSAADMFAAGFQDHGIGKIIGIDPSSGGGGANVWMHGNILDNLPATMALPLAKLPDGIQMAIAFRRCVRVGRNQGADLEDWGVRPDFRYYPDTAEEAWKGFPSIVRLACSILGEARDFSINVTEARFSGSVIEIAFESRNVETIVVRTSWLKSLQIKVSPGQNGVIRIAYPQNARRSAAGVKFSVEGFASINNELVTVVPPIELLAPVRPPAP